MSYLKIIPTALRGITRAYLLSPNWITQAGPISEVFDYMISLLYDGTLLYLSAYLDHSDAYDTEPMHKC